MKATSMEGTLITIAHFVLIRKQTWPSKAIIVSGWSILKHFLFWKRLTK